MEAASVQGNAAAFDNSKTRSNEPKRISDRVDPGRDCDAHPIDFERADSSKPCAMSLEAPSIEWGRSTHASLRFPGMAVHDFGQPEHLAQRKAWQPEQQQEFSSWQNAESIETRANQVSLSTLVSGAGKGLHLLAKFAEQEEKLFTNFSHNSSPRFFQDECIPHGAFAVGTCPQVTEYAKANNSSFGHSDQSNASYSDQSNGPKIDASKPKIDTNKPKIDTSKPKIDIMLQQLEEVIRIIPTERKQAYLESLKACEVKPLVFYLQFLRRCDYNVWEAAERLVRYWQKRKELFGERAFLPMTLTGDGALTKEDVLTLKGGYPAVLPDAITGQKVLFFDRTQMLPHASRENKLRCVFYLLQLLADQDEKAQTDGIMVLGMVSLPKWRDTDRVYNNQTLTLAENIMPARLNYHFLNYPPAPDRRYVFQDLIQEVIEVVAVNSTALRRVSVHFERGKGELLDTLLGLGLKRENLPTRVGGSFCLYAECAKWFRNQHFRESRKRKRDLKLCSSVLDSTGDGTNAAASGTAFDTSIAPDTVIDPTPSRLDPEEKKRKTREMNLISSRRKRERRRAEFRRLKDKHDDLLGEHESLLLEHARLMRLLHQAKQLVPSVVLKTTPSVNSP